MKRRRPARPVDDVTDQDRRRMGDPVPRYLYRSGGSLVLAMPPEVVEHLGALVGQRVWWYVGAGREGIVTMSPRRVGGRPGGLHAARELTAARAEIVRLKRRLGARPEAIFNEGVNEGRMRHVGELVTLGEKLDALASRVDELAARMPFGRYRHGRARPSPASPASPSRPVDAIPLPDLPSLPCVSGGADTSGTEESPGVPLHT